MCRAGCIHVGPRPAESLRLCRWSGALVEDSLRSFVGILPLPVLHGLTVGELACMIKGEDWGSTARLDLTVIPLLGWRHGDRYSLPVKPSPNLPNDTAIRFYPSLCFFEATRVSVGRGYSICLFKWSVIPIRHTGLFYSSPYLYPDMIRKSVTMR